MALALRRVRSLQDDRSPLRPACREVPHNPVPQGQCRRPGGVSRAGSAAPITQTPWQAQQISNTPPLLGHTPCMHDPASEVGMSRRCDVHMQSSLLQQACRSAMANRYADAVCFPHQQCNESCNATCMCRRRRWEAISTACIVCPCHAMTAPS